MWLDCTAVARDGTDLNETIGKNRQKTTENTPKVFIETEISLCYTTMAFRADDAKWHDLAEGYCNVLKNRIRYKKKNCGYSAIGAEIWNTV